MRRLLPRAGGDRGQILVVFSLALIAIVAMTGLVIDGGATFVQRRDMQNVADAASLAGAYAYVNGSDAVTAARTNAAANGYTHGQNGVTVDVTVTNLANGTNVIVGVDKPHQNYFSGIVGLRQFAVSTTATSITGAPNGAYGAMPLIFNQRAFNGTQGQEQDFDEPGSGNQDVPQTATQFNWTVFCTHNGNSCNASSSDVRDLIDDAGSGTILVTLNEDIGPLNNGSHTTLFSALAGKVGGKYPVAIVDDAGRMQGWAIFHLTGSNGGSVKQIRGWFEGPVEAPPLTIVQGGGTGSSAFGGYVVQLTN